MNLSIAPQGALPEFAQRERGQTHTSFEEENLFYGLIEQGLYKEIPAVLDRYVKNGIIVGKMSENVLQQTRYWAVCCITLGIRAAMRGGLDEIFAYNLSDEFIMQIDKMVSAEQIVGFIVEKVTFLTETVAKTLKTNSYVYVRKCMQYIDKNLHREIPLCELAELVHKNSNYLSRVFKAQVGRSINNYIVFKKLELSKKALSAGFGIKQTAYDLGFCSESYFIERFKKEYGTTPGAYLLGKRTLPKPPGEPPRKG